MMQMTRTILLAPVFFTLVSCATSPAKENPQTAEVGKMKDAQVYVVHGYMASPRSHWFPWLQTRIEAEGGKTSVLELPDFPILPVEPI